MDEAKTKHILITRNGPYKVTAGITLNQSAIACDAEGESLGWQEGREYDTGKGDYYLCRCGHSARKPFCDGWHLTIGFSPVETPPPPPYLKSATRYQGPGLDLLDQESLCMGAGFCDRAGGAWERLRTTDTADSRAVVIQEACDCPGGRLTAVTKDGNLIEPHLREGIGLIQDTANECRGPLWVKGGIPIRTEAGVRYEIRNRVTLCRCGESANMPFCDASHYDCPHMLGRDV